LINAKEAKGTNKGRRCKRLKIEHLTEECIQNTSKELERKTVIKRMAHNVVSFLNGI